MPIKREVTYPNAFGLWKGCPETCPDDCPFEDCTMPVELAVKRIDKALLPKIAGGGRQAHGQA